MEIPFNKEYYTGKEKEYILDVLNNKKHTSGDGFYTKKISHLLENMFTAKKVLMTTSGTHALEMAANLIGLKENDEVIMPSYTFSSTANAILRFGAKPIFVEIEDKNLNIDPNKIEKKITKNTKAIMPIHYAGIGADMDDIMKIASENNLYVIEDAAQAVNSKYKGDYLGTIGHLGCFSFHSTKNYISGEGGALLINLEDEKLFEKAAIIREKGTNRSSFLRGEVDKYTWVGQGSSYLPSDLLMAFLYAQLQNVDKIKIMREKIFLKYQNEFSKYNKKDFLRSIVQIPEDRVSNFNSFYFIFDNNEYREYVIKKLKEKNINATFHYIPLHLSKMGRKLGYKRGDLPITEKMSQNIMRLPLYTDMNDKEIEYIIKNVKEIFEGL